MARGSPLLPASPPHTPHREQSQTALSPRELNAHRCVGLTKDARELGKRVTLG